MSKDRYDWEDLDDWNPYDPPRRKAWDCPLCGTDNRGDRTDCRVCMCPHENLCTKCKKANEPIARYCRFCGSLIWHNRYGVFDPEVRKREAKSSRETIRRYKKYGHYYEWEDGPYQGPEEMYR